MSKKLNWAVNIQVAGGPTISTSDTMEVEAYDVIQTTIADQANNQEVQVQPGPLASVRFVLITADSYSDELTYTVNDGAADGATDVKLDGLQLLIGQGAGDLLQKAPAKLAFTNKAGKAIGVTILVGRKATA
jgi:hypothetical protein